MILGNFHFEAAIMSDGIASHPKGDLEIWYASLVWLGEEPTCGMLQQFSWNYREGLWRLCAGRLRR